MADASSFVSKEWIGTIPFVAWSLAVGLTGAQITVTSDPHRGFFLYLAVATGLMALVRWMLARPSLDAARAAIAMRWIALAQGVIGLVLAGWLLLLGHPGSAVLVVVVGAALLAIAWPWAWSLRRRDRDRSRPYRGSSFVSALLAGALAVVVGSLWVFELVFGPEPTGASARVAPSGVTMAGLMFVLAAEAFVQAWDERRRPRGTGPMPAVPAPSGP